MHTLHKWLLLVALAVFATPLPLLAAEPENPVSGSVEAGVSTLDIQDSKLRVNEYSTTRADDGTGVYGKVNIDAASDQLALKFDGDLQSADDQDYELQLDVMRRLKLDSSYNKFFHWLDHDKLDYLNAGIPSGATAAATLNGLATSDPANYAFQAATNVNGTTIGRIWSVPDFSWLDANNVTGYIGYGASGQLYAFNPGLPYFNTSQIVNAPEAISWQQLGRASLLGEDFVPSQDFFISHEQYENEAELKLIPNVTLRVGHRLETRQGMAQSIGMSKCTACHITGQSKVIDEETEDLTIGATGKFGLLTVDYEFLDRTFDNKAADPTRVYDPALSPNPNTQYTPGNSTFDNRLLYDYEAGALAYDTTPDSEKTSHVLKARVDLPKQTSLLGSFVSAEARSNKTNATGIALNQSRLTTSYDGYGFKATTRLTDTLTVKARVKAESVETDPFSYTLTPLNTTSTATLGGAPDPSFYTDLARSAAADGDTLTTGIDAIWRFGRYSSLRLGYELEKFDRDETELGDTDTQTVKAKVKTRFTRQLNAWASYTYQKIDEPFRNPDAAAYIDPFTGLSYYDKDQEPNGAGTINSTWTGGYLIGSGPTYGTDYYDLRSLDMTNLPEDVHEAKLSTTWSPASNFSTTLALRARFEENQLDNSTWKERTLSPSLSMWYAPTEKLNLTFLYNYLGQRSEAKFCQGWYDG